VVGATSSESFSSYQFIQSVPAMLEVKCQWHDRTVVFEALDTTVLGALPNIINFR